MPWPLSQDYNEAIQSPDLSFSDAELKQTEARCNAIGIPMPRSGNFADVYEMTHPSGKRWAVKCFTRQVPGLRERYAAISAHLKQVNLPFMVNFAYLEQGIRVRGVWYPALKMQWVEGLTLNEFVREHADQPQHLDLLCQIWVRLARRLREASMAHCDLQHGNVLLVQGSQARSLAVRLIDYDGMFVPALADQQSGEVGHPAYQHPQRLRKGTYSAEVDRFPHLVIYTALRSLMLGSRYLWNKYDNGDNLLFRQDDLEAPQKSALFAELRKLNDAAAGRLLAALARAAHQPLDQAPLLDDLVPATAAVTTRRTVATPQPSRAEETPESIFASATAGDAPAASFRSRRERRSSRTWVWASAAVAMLTLGVGGAIFLAGRGGPSDTRPDAVAHTDSGKGAKDTDSSRNDEETAKTDLDSAKMQVPKIEPKPEPPREVKVELPAPPVEIPSPQLAYIRNEPGSGFTRHQLSIANRAAFPDELFEPSPDLPPIGSNKSASRTVVQVYDENDRHLQGFVALRSAADMDRLWFAVQKETTPPRQVYVVLEDRKLQRTYRSNRVPIAASTPEQAEGELRRFAGHWGGVSSVAFSPDGRQAVSGASDRTVRLWDVESGKELRRFEGHTQPVSSVGWSFVDHHILSGGQDKTVRMWDTETAKQLERFENHADFVWTVALSPNGLYALSGSRDKTTRLWDTKTGKELRRFEGHSGCVHGAAFSPDGQHILTGSCDRSVRLWEVQTGKLVRTFAGHTGQVNSVAFIPDGRSALSGSWDNTLRLWDVQTGQEMRRFEGHTDVIHSIAISPDGRWALSGSGGHLIEGKFVAGTDNTLRLWDIASGKELHRFTGHTDAVRTVAFSPDGRRALSGSNDHTLRLWALPDGAAAKPES